MDDKKKKEFKPQTLRVILGVMFAIIILGGGGLFYLGLGLLRDYATEVDHKLIDADASGQQISELQTLKNQLSQNNSLVEKANQIFANPSTYQSQALSDIRKYADASGLTISSTNFDSTAGTYAMTITLKQPVSFKNLVGFLNNIEGSLPKLQVTSIALGQAGGSGPDGIRAGDIKIGIAVQ
jgi:hypothetical protein